MRGTSVPLARPALALALVACSGAGADEPGRSSATYSREVVRIFARKCVACHARGDEVPLETYADVRPWARAIREEVLERRMPPWSAAHGVQPLANDLFLRPREIAAIVSWADGGAPRGDVADLPPRAPGPPWPAGPPSLVLPVPLPPAPAGGGPHVRRVSLPGLRSERWLRGFDLAPSARRSVRAAFLFLAARGAAGEQWLGGWTRWHAMTRAPEGAAYRVPAGAALVLEVHGQAGASGEPSSDGVELGLYLDTVPPAAAARSLGILAAGGTSPGSPLRGEATLDEDTKVWALWPRLAGRGDALEVAAVAPDGAKQPLLWLTGHEPGWPTPYVLRNPVALPRGSRLVVTAHARSAGAPPPSAAVVAAAYAPRASERDHVSSAGAPRP